MSNNECRAIEVIGQDWSSEVVTLFLEDWELGRVAFELPHGQGLSLPRNEGWMLGWLRVAGFSLLTLFPVLEKISRRRVGGSGAWKVNCHSKRRPSSHRGRAVTHEGEGCGERK